MILTTFDWSIIFLIFAVSLGVEIWTARTASKSSQDYFTASGKMPWWLDGWVSFGDRLDLAKIHYLGQVLSNLKSNNS
ncbi:MAG: hypothetical protein ACFHWX_06405 [Bacteroidota bacterium]